MKEQAIPKDLFEGYFRKLSRLTLFEGLKPKRLRSLMSMMTQVSIGGGDILITEGEEDYSMYIVVFGRLQVHRGRSRKHFKKPIAEIHPGDVVGEISLLTDQARTATVVAKRDCILLKLSQESYKTFEKEHMDAAFKLARTSLQRLTKQEKPRGELGAEIITIAPAGDSNHYDFAHILTQKLRQVGPTMYIDDKICDENCKKPVSQCQPGSECDQVILRWIQSLEDKYDYIVFVTDRQMTPWTERCLREADHTLFIADSSVHHAVNSIEIRYFENPENLYRTSDLIFMHPVQTDIITGSARWLKERPVTGFHHLAHNNEEHLNSIKRILTNQAIGLVLNGGGARGYAHLGVLQALYERNVPIDFIAGTSMGAVVGAVYARHGLEKGRELAQEFARTYRNDYTFPYIALTSGERVTRFYQKIYDDVDIEDLWLKFFCVSCNLTKGELRLHETGELWQAIRMSTSIPAVFPPLYVDGDMYVDGGIMNNMPINLMRDSMRGGKIIAVNCFADCETKSGESYDSPWVSGWRLLLKSLFRSNKDEVQPDNIVSVILGSINLASNDHQNLVSKDADYLIEVETSQFGVLDFHCAAEIEEVGYQAAIKRLDELGL